MTELEALSKRKRDMICDLLASGSRLERPSPAVREELHQVTARINVLAGRA